MSTTSEGGWTEHQQQAKKQAIATARTLLMRKDWIIIDTETTGIDDDDEVWQFGYTGPGASVTLNYTCKPTVPCCAEAAAVNGWTPAMTQNAPPFLTYYPLICQAMANKIVMAYNLSFDARLLNQTARLYGLPPLFDNVNKYEPACLVSNRPTQCLMGLYAAFKGAWDSRINNFRHQRLPGAKHDAKSDCLAAAELLRVIAAG